MYLDDYMNACPGFGWEGGPTFNTQVITLTNGRERRNAQWSQPKHVYSAPFNNIQKPAYREIKRMFMVCRGQLHAFRFRDQLDYQASNEVFAVGDGSEDTFQLYKSSTADGETYLRGVYALAEVPVITIDGTPTTAFTANLRTGKVVFTSPPADGAILSWSGTFDVWVRFSEDQIPFTLDNPNATNGSVNLVEIAPPQE